jgi:hypothetical protein
MNINEMKEYFKKTTDNGGTCLGCFGRFGSLVGKGSVSDGYEALSDERNIPGVILKVKTSGSRKHCRSEGHGNAK